VQHRLRTRPPRVITALSRLLRRQQAANPHAAIFCPSATETCRQVRTRSAAAPQHAADCVSRRTASTQSAAAAVGCTTPATASAFVKQGCTHVTVTQQSEQAALRSTRTCSRPTPAARDAGSRRRRSPGARRRARTPSGQRWHVRLRQSAAHTRLARLPAAAAEHRTRAAAACSASARPYGTAAPAAREQAHMPRGALLPKQRVLRPPASRVACHTPRCRALPAAKCRRARAQAVVRWCAEMVHRVVPIALFTRSPRSVTAERSRGRAVERRARACSVMR
jgi:hypothetical protein